MLDIDWTLQPSPVFFLHLKFLKMQSPEKTTSNIVHRTSEIVHAFQTEFDLEEFLIEIIAISSIDDLPKKFYGQVLQIVDLHRKINNS